MAQVVAVVVNVQHVDEVPLVVVEEKELVWVLAVVLALMLIEKQ
jgi:hypothetical protein